LTLAAGGVFEGIEDWAGEGGVVCFQINGASELADGGGVEGRGDDDGFWDGVDGPECCSEQG